MRWTLVELAEQAMDIPSPCRLCKEGHHYIFVIGRMAANALTRAHRPMGEFVRRYKGRLGKAEGIVAGAHKLARIIWAIIVSGQPYDENKVFETTLASTAPGSNIWQKYGGQENPNVSAPIFLLETL